MHNNNLLNTYCSPTHQVAQIICPLEGLSVPYAVSVVAKPCDVPHTVLPVINNSMSKLHNDTFGVCVSPVHSEYDDWLRFVENVETNRLFGAKYFMFYNMSIGSNVDQLMRSYARDGIAEVIQWNPPRKMLAHYRGQDIAINDCLYRLSSRVGYILFADLDELAVPNIHDNWASMIKYVTENGTLTSFGSFNFRSSVFPTVRNYKETRRRDSATKSNSMVRIYSRSKFIFYKFKRSKYIAVARKVENVGVHFVRKHTGDFTCLVLDTSVGLLHHYRAGLTLPGEPTVVDRSMQRFRKKITAATEKRFKKVKLSYKRY